MGGKIVLPNVDQERGRYLSMLFQGDLCSSVYQWMYTINLI